MLDDFLGYLGIVLLVINTCLYIKSYSNIKDTVALKYFNWYLLLICIIQIIVLILAYNKIDNLYLSHFYFILQFIFLSLFYKELFEKNQIKWIYIAFIIVFISLIIQYSLKPQLFYKFNIFEVFITSFPLIVYSIVHLYNSLSKKGQFIYINAGVLMYITISTLIFILGDYLSNYSNESISNIWFLNKVFYVGYLVLILIEWKKNILPLKSK